MRAARVRAQAKINEMLRVGPRDETNGYHDLITVFRRIDLADEVTIRTGGVRRTLDVSGPRVPPQGLGPVEKNLAYRAAVEFAGLAGWPDGFEIQLTKHIPVGAGLGGGSADAGGVLRALNAVAPEPLPEAAILSIAGALGADVPFLTKDWPMALGRSRGDHLMDLSILAKAASDVLIVVPGFSISTADAYRWVDEDREKSGGWTAPGVPAIGSEDHENDFEPVMDARFPELRQIRERLVEKGANWALLAGSGSCVFGVFHDTAPSDADLGLDLPVIRTRLSTRVVQVEVLE
jgi:4-diphosphocytidyl-2-C-methyl-D-erythritol kinase